MDIIDLARVTLLIDELEFNYTSLVGLAAESKVFKPGIAEMGLAFDTLNDALEKVIEGLSPAEQKEFEEAITEIVDIDASDWEQDHDDDDFDFN